MSKKALKLQFAGSNQGGFTLTEVMIGMMILTVAIVAATQILIGLIGFNQNNVNSLKAHYLAISGIEIVRNIRDTNWLHNQDWLGEGSEILWGENLLAGPDADNPHVLGVEAQEVAGGAIDLGADFSQWKPFAPWQIASGALPVEFLNSEDGAGDSVDTENGTVFSREIQILPYEGEECLAVAGASDAGADAAFDDCSNFVLVKSRVTFTQGIDERTIELQAILTNWKDGAL